jgi:hypothetical protein
MGDKETVILTISDVTTRRTLEDRVVEEERLRLAGFILKQGQANSDFNSKSLNSLFHQELPDSSINKVDAVTVTKNHIGSAKLLLGKECQLNLANQLQKSEINCLEHDLLLAIYSSIHSAAVSGAKNISISLNQEHISQQIGLIDYNLRQGEYLRIQIEDDLTSSQSQLLMEIDDEIIRSYTQLSRRVINQIVCSRVLRNYFGFAIFENRRSSFVINLYFPIHDASTAQMKRSQSFKALIVGDTLSGKPDIARALRELGYVTEECYDLAQLKNDSNKFDLVVIDNSLANEQGELFSSFEENGTKVLQLDVNNEERRTSQQIRNLLT